jgi:hypothetical protein
MTATKLIKKMQRVTRNRPETRTANLSFFRKWAYGNAGIENSSITPEQVERVIVDVPKKKRLL